MDRGNEWVEDRWFLDELSSVSWVESQVESQTDFKDPQRVSWRKELPGWGLLPWVGINLLHGLKRQIESGVLTCR